MGFRYLMGLGGDQHSGPPNFINRFDERIQKNLIGNHSQNWR